MIGCSRSSLPRRFHEGGEERRSKTGILGAFGVPLDADHVWPVGTSDRLDDPIRGGGDDLEVAGIDQRLAMSAVHLSVELLPRHRMEPSVRMVVGGVERVRKMLLQLASGVKAEELHAETDRQDGQIRVSIGEEIENLQFEGLAIGIDQAGLRMDRVPEGRGVRIVASGQDEPVETGNDLHRGPGKRGEWDRHRTGGLQRAEVGPANPNLVVDEVGRHPDEGPSAMGG